MLDERKLKILGAIVDEYILTGEPVGSKTIAKLDGINVSSATIRNDMVILEQLGYLEQPHTSAGRIPTFSGYRLYIDKIMKENPLSDEDKKMLDSMLDTDAPTEEALIQSASTALAEITKCAVVASNLAPKYSVITKVEVIPTGKRLYVLLLITSSGSIKNKVCRLEFDLTPEQIDFFTKYMDENLHGVSLESLSEEMFQQIIVAMGAYMMTLSPLINAVYEMSKGLMQKELTVSGEKNLLQCKDFDHNEIVAFLEHKNEITELLDESFSGIQVLFGKEKDTFVIGNSSMISSQVKKDGKTAGSIGIIGPMRINYAKVIPYIEYFTEKISDIISEEEKTEKGNEENE